MAATRSYANVTQSIWDCLKSSSIAKQGTVYDPSDGNAGTATTETVVGKLVLQFAFDPSGASVSYTIDSKPFLVTEGEIWNGIQDSINACSGGGSADDVPTEP
jgi:hypothetical protein